MAQSFSGRVNSAPLRFMVFVRDLVYSVRFHNLLLTSRHSAHIGLPSDVSMGGLVPVPPALDHGESWDLQKFKEVWDGVARVGSCGWG